MATYYEIITTAVVPALVLVGSSSMYSSFGASGISSTVRGVSDSAGYSSSHSFSASGVSVTETSAASYLDHRVSNSRSIGETVERFTTQGGYSPGSTSYRTTSTESFVEVYTSNFTAATTYVDSSASSLRSTSTTSTVDTYPSLLPAGGSMMSLGTSTREATTLIGVMVSTTTSTISLSYQESSLTWWYDKIFGGTVPVVSPNVVIDTRSEYLATA